MKKERAVSCETALSRSEKLLLYELPGEPDAH